MNHTTKYLCWRQKSMEDQVAFWRDTCHNYAEEDHKLSSWLILEENIILQKWNATPLTRMSYSCVLINKYFKETDAFQLIFGYKYRSHFERPSLHFIGGWIQPTFFKRLTANFCSSFNSCWNECIPSIKTEIINFSPAW